MFSKGFRKWIYTNIIKIENKNGDEILTVKDGNYKYDISFERFSNNIEPIYVCDQKENNINNKWMDLMSDEIINNSLYVTKIIIKNRK